MKKLSAAILVFLLAASAGTATAGWTHKMSVYSPTMQAWTRGVATVTIETPTDFKLSTDDPPTISVITPEGVTLKKVNRGSKIAVRPGASATAFEIVLSASQKGRHQLAAEVDFSICTARSCTPVSERLSFDVVVE